MHPNAYTHINGHKLVFFLSHYLRTTSRASRCRSWGAGLGTERNSRGAQAAPTDAALRPLAKSSAIDNDVCECIMNAQYVRVARVSI